MKLCGACLFVVLVAAGCTTSSERWLYVDEGATQDLARHRVMEQALSVGTRQTLAGDDWKFVLTGHRISRGDGLIIAMRSFSGGAPLLTDQATFRKITIRLPKHLATATEIAFPNSDGAFAFVSDGPSSHPGASGCIGYALRGLVKIDRRAAEAALVNIDLTFARSSPSGFHHECQDYHLRGIYSAERTEFEKLTPWLGRPGASIYQEAIAP